MSYCRIGEDSDVYLIATGGAAFSLWVRTNAAAEYPDMPLLIHPRGRRQCLELLRALRSAGVKVPGRATNRLRRELAK